MKTLFELVSARRSIRKFKAGDVPAEDIEYFIKTAVTAPSGCNSQCWQFVAVRDRETIHRLEQAVIEKIEAILAPKRDELTEEYIASKKKMATFFVNAPVVIAVFMTESRYYDPQFISVLKDQGYDDQAIMELFAHYDILSVGAAIQNLLLAVVEKGYGACWMNEPAIAGQTINTLLDVPMEHRFISLIPIGHPSYEPRGKAMKEFEDVFSLI